MKIKCLLIPCTEVRNLIFNLTLTGLILVKINLIEVVSRKKCAMLCPKK